MTQFDDMPDVSAREMRSAMFQAIWEVIQKWDVNSPDHYLGYCGANGSHVKLILDGIEAVREQRVQDAMYFVMGLATAAAANQGVNIDVVEFREEIEARLTEAGLGRYVAESREQELGHG